MMADMLKVKILMTKFITSRITDFICIFSSTYMLRWHKVIENIKDSPAQTIVHTYLYMSM